MLQRTSGARPNTHIVVKGARQKQRTIADEFKTQGNSYFVSLEYSNAIECYTRCLKHIIDGVDPSDMRTIVFSNRSQCYLKLRAYMKAFEDANEAVECTPEHVKSLGRRGTAAFYLKKYKIARADFEKVMELDPTNTGFTSFLKTIEGKMV